MDLCSAIERQVHYRSPCAVPLVRVGPSRGFAFVCGFFGFSMWSSFMSRHYPPTTTNAWTLTLVRVMSSPARSFQTLTNARICATCTRSAWAAAVKAFTRRHEDSHPLLEAVSSPSRLMELYPLLQTRKPFAVQQAREPLWPSGREDASGRRAPRSLAAHVLQRAVRGRRLQSDASEAAGPSTEAADACSVRGDAELFVRPQNVVFKGG